MHNHIATIRWSRAGADFAKNTYSRAHEWRFDGGARVAASASPDIVPIPYSDPTGVDPEEAFVASLASCHMLFVLSFAQQAGLVIEHYTDDAVGHLTKSDAGDLWISKVELNPCIDWHGATPADAVIEQLHHKAHKACFIANSVRTEVVTHIINA